MNGRKLTSFNRTIVKFSMHLSSLGREYSKVLSCESTLAESECPTRGGFESLKYGDAAKQGMKDEFILGI